MANVETRREKFKTFINELDEHTPSFDETKKYLDKNEDVKDKMGNRVLIGSLVATVVLLAMAGIAAILALPVAGLLLIGVGLMGVVGGIYGFTKETTTASAILLYPSARLITGVSRMLGITDRPAPTKDPVAKSASESKKGPGPSPRKPGSRYKRDRYPGTGTGPPKVFKTVPHKKGKGPDVSTSLKPPGKSGGHSKSE